MPEAIANPAPGRARPHVVWIICDQLRADALGFMGSPLARTPNLDRLARRGTVFDNLFIQSSVCCASRACMITGRYPRSVRMENGSSLLDPRETTLPEILQRNGYRTGLFGKLHLTPQQYTWDELKSDRAISDAAVFLKAAALPPADGDPVKKNYGFQEVVSHEDMLWGDYIGWLEQRDPKLAALQPRRPKSGMSPWDGWHQDFPDSKVLWDVGTTVTPPALHPSWFIAESAADFFTRHSREAPCFMQVSFVDPHHPWDPPTELARHYPVDEMPLPRYSDPGGLVWPPMLAARTPDFRSVTPAMTRKVIAYYHAMIEMIDLAVGQLIEAVERAGQMDNTIFAFAADHGELLGDYGLFRKGSYHYDCLIRSPGFLSCPALVPAGQRIPGLVRSIDLAPTLLGLAGLAAVPGMQGADLSRDLAQPATIGQPWVYTELFTSQWGPFVNCWTLRTATAKLNYFPTDRVGHLMDLTTDPDERVDLFASPAHRELRDTMMANLLEEIRRQADPLPRILSQY